MLNGATVNIQISDGSDFEAIPADKYTVQITDVNLKSQFNSFKQIEEDILNYELTVLSDKVMEVEKDGKPESEPLRGRKLWKRCTPKFNPKSWLFKLASAANGAELTKEEQEAFQPESIIDKQVDVMIEIVDGVGKNAGKKFNNVLAFAKTTKPLTPFENDKSKEGPVRETKPVAMTDEESDDFIAGVEKDKNK